MRIAAWLIYFYLRLVWATSRVTVSGNTVLRDAALAGRARMVYAMWHGRLAGATYDSLKGIEITAIASRSADGELAARFVAPFGMKVIRGSSANPRKPTKDKGGAAAMVAALRFFRGNEHGTIGVTPDGPKGPRGVCHHGVATIAIRAQVPVVPAAWSARRAIRFRSWDRFLMPLPFSDITYLWGEALTPPTEADKDTVERFRQEVERALLDLTVEADRRAGRTETFTQAVKKAAG